jgi:thiamine-monophosphate kinase
MLVAGTHFLPNADPGDLGWKTLAVNVSDIAAMGAAPRWALLAAALPAATETWVAAFAKGFFECADAFGIDIVGGDTTKGPRNFCVTIFGEVPQGEALLRSGAKPGDEIWVSGKPGLAALGLAHLQGRCVLEEPALTACLAALHRPQPRVALGLALRGIASAAIDVSDGLLADLGHVMEQSKTAATVHFERLPGLALAFGDDSQLARDCLLAGGDDYELAFTAPAARHAEIEALAASLRLALACIGTVAAGDAGTVNLLENGRPMAQQRRGFDHFGA